MATLYIRDVSETVAATLKDRAAASGQSLSGYVVAQLEMLAARPDNEEIVARLRTRDRTGGPSVERIVTELAQSRR